MVEDEALDGVCELQESLDPRNICLNLGQEDLVSRVLDLLVELGKILAKGCRGGERGKLEHADSFSHAINMVNGRFPVPLHGFEVLICLRDKPEHELRLCGLLELRHGVEDGGLRVDRLDVSIAHIGHEVVVQGCRLGLECINIGLNGRSKAQGKSAA